MSSEHDFLINCIDEAILAYEQNFLQEDCHIFFSSEEDAKLFYNQETGFLKSFKSLDIETIRSAARNLADFNLNANISYIIAIDVMSSFKTSTLRKLLAHPSSSMAKNFYEMTNAAENCLAQTYLNFELDRFVTFNEIRMQNIQKLPDNKTLYLYEAHLLWLDKLISALRNMDVSEMPELHPEKCIVGQWLSSNAHELITDETVLNEFTNLHKDLHYISKKIELSFQSKPIDFNILILLLKKAELLSLSLGVELSILSNIKYQETASKDPLTGTLNRQLLFQIFSNQFGLSRAVEKGFCLIITDLDDFKKVNDVYGHVQGDKVLKSFAQMIMKNVRESDFVVRFGGEEFLLILPTTEIEDAVNLAEKLKDNTHLLQKENDLTTMITASFGVIDVIPHSDSNINEDLMSNYIDEADKELYFAKKYGKDRVSSSAKK